MGVLCFVLDLRSLSPSLLRQLKQSLLQLANYYAIYTPSGDGSSKTRSKPLLNRMILCYVFTNRISCAAELKVAYSPRGNFNLRDFHHAVNNLPTDAFSPEFSSGSLSCADIKISSVLSDNVLYSWGGHDEGVTRKLFLISSCIVRNLDCDTKIILMDAADQCVSVEFIFIEHESDNLGASAEKINNFVKQIGDLENCSFRSYLPDPHVFAAMVKEWFQELKDDMEKLLQTRFIFKCNLIENVNQFSCNLYRCFNPILDEFISCQQTCRCHGNPMDKPSGDMNSLACPVTGRDLGEIDVIENSVKIGESTILLMPSFQCCQNLPQVSSPVDFTVVERTPLESLNEGVIFGAAYVVAPSTYIEFDDIDKLEQNIQLFLVVCHLLNSLDHGLVCSSYCNVQTMRESSFPCYYLLLPSDKGMMLLRRLVASEETLPAYAGRQHTYSTMAKGMEGLVQSALLKMEARAYDPLQHERGFHQKLNFLVKESLQFGEVPPKIKEAPGESSSAMQDSEEVSGPVQTAAVDDMPPLNEDIENKTSSCIADEWEQLIVTELPVIRSPIPMKPRLDYPLPSQLQSNRQVDERTSKILERLEVPKQLKKKTASPRTTDIGTAEPSMLTKKPLIPFGLTQAEDQVARTSQPIKPNFPKLKSKR